MAITINTNVAALGVQKNLAANQKKLGASLGRLSSGQRINQASDDAAGLGISERLKAQIRGLSQASRNTNDGISMVQVAEGAMNEQAAILTRLRELAVQSSNGTLGTDERGFIQAEVDELVGEFDRISEVTEFNGISLLDGANGTVDFQVGLNEGDTITLTLAESNTDTLLLTGLNLGADATTSAGWLDEIDAAITSLSGSRSAIGAVQNRLEITVSNLATAHENISAANSRIRDVDVAEETANMTRNQILSQAGVAVLSQANQLPSMALSLLG